jgi:2-polyprenyl-3-methyl-5-hydroxy-6-metoxy-1,4-benzoquinol methylase
VSHLPSESEINNFYQGFNFQTDLCNYDLIATLAIKEWLHGFNLPQNAKMLDVGGGGGFFAKAFQEFGFGESTYVDLDSGACDFAKDQMELERVICDSVENGDNYFKGQKFDFIYCRHVVEHLVNPAQLIMQCAELLSEKGTFIVQCPNGLSRRVYFIRDIG